MEEVKKTIEQFFSTVVKGEYSSDNYPFFDESDIVYLMHKELMGHNSKNIRIYREYPVVPSVPLSISALNFKIINDRFDIDKYFDHKNNRYYLKDIMGNLANDVIIDLFHAIRSDNFLKNKRIIESKYVDLAICRYSPCQKDDDIVPEIIIEFKYEVDCKRKGNDLRQHISLPKNNLQAILGDIYFIYQFGKSHPLRKGYFVLIDEGGKFINNKDLRIAIDQLGLQKCSYDFGKCQVLILSCT
jgi:hypothetical protein